MIHPKPKTSSTPSFVLHSYSLHHFGLNSCQFNVMDVKHLLPTDHRIPQKVKEKKEKPAKEKKEKKEKKEQLGPKRPPSGYFLFADAVRNKIKYFPLHNHPILNLQPLLWTLPWAYSDTIIIVEPMIQLLGLQTLPRRWAPCGER